MNKAPDHLHIVIPAGGVGTRLWPRSRQDNPKQFLLLTEGKSVTQKTFERLDGFIPLERIYVIAEDRYKLPLLEQIPGFKPGNFISEPERRGTSAAIGLAAAFIKKRDPHGVVHFLVSDDHIENVSRFRKMVALAASLADEKKSLVVYGVEPSYPATGYGYIQVEKKLSEEEGIPIYKVKRFVEKPSEEKARQYISSGDYFWHGSGFTSRADVLLGELKTFWPQGFQLLSQISELSGLPADEEEGKMINLYRKIEKNAIEFTVLEKSEKILMVTLEKTWRDIASWETIWELSPKDKNGNVVIKSGSKGELVKIDSTRNLVHFDDQMVALIGVSDLIIVDTKDAILICRRERAQDVKKVVEFLKEQGKKEYL